MTKAVQRMDKKLKIKIQFINPEPEAAMEPNDLELVEQNDVRPGFYKDVTGHWRVDRRECPERRKTTAPKSATALRKMMRRRVDRQALKFLRGIDE